MSKLKQTNDTYLESLPNILAVIAHIQNPSGSTEQEVVDVFKTGKYIRNDGIKMATVHNALACGLELGYVTFNKGRYKVDTDINILMAATYLKICENRQRARPKREYRPKVLEPRPVAPKAKRIPNAEETIEKPASLTVKRRDDVNAYPEGHNDNDDLDDDYYDDGTII